jgi:ribosome modulation factor
MTSARPCPVGASNLTRGRAPLTGPPFLAYSDRRSKAAPLELFVVRQPGSRSVETRTHPPNSECSMRTQKRNSKARAWHQGYRAGVRGRPRSQCPRGALGLRSQWLEGWLLGAEERANGTLALFGLHKPR